MPKPKSRPHSRTPRSDEGQRVIHGYASRCGIAGWHVKRDRKGFGNQRIERGLLFRHSTIDECSLDICQRGQKQAAVPVYVVAVSTQSGQAFVEHCRNAASSASKIMHHGLRYQAAARRSTEERRIGLPPGG